MKLLSYEDEQLEDLSPVEGQGLEISSKKGEQVEVSEEGEGEHPLGEVGEKVVGPVEGVETGDLGAEFGDVECELGGVPELEEVESVLVEES